MVKIKFKQIANISANKLLGRGATSGTTEEIGLSDDFTVSGGTLNLVNNDLYISDVTTVNLLDDLANWDINGKYTGTAITGTLQGQKHYNSTYFFECVHDNVWIRLARA